MVFLKFNMITDTLKLNLGFFSVSVITQLTFLNSLYHKGHDLMFKDEVISDKALIIVGLNIFLIALCILYSFILNKASPRLPKSGSIGLLEKISVLLSSLSTIVAVYLTSLFVLNREFTDFVNLPFGFKLHFNWTVSERLEYIRDILKERAVPEPVDLELRVRGTTSMDSIRDLAKSVEQSHIEKLRAAIEAKAHIGVDVGSSGVLDDMNNWMHAHSWEIAATCAFICAAGVTISVIVFVSYATKVDKTLADLQSNIEILDKNMIGLTKDSPGAKVISEKLDSAMEKIANFDNDMESTILSAIVKHDRGTKLNLLADIEKILLRSGELSRSHKPYSSVNNALFDIANTTFENEKAIARLMEDSANARPLTGLEEGITAKINTIDMVSNALLQSRDIHGEFYPSVYAALTNLAKVTIANEKAINFLRISDTANSYAIKGLKPQVGALKAAVKSLRTTVESAAPEQAAAVASAISESGL